MYSFSECPSSTPHMSRVTNNKSAATAKLNKQKPNQKQKNMVRSPKLNEDWQTIPLLPVGGQGVNPSLVDGPPLVAKTSNAMGLPSSLRLSNIIKLRNSRSKLVSESNLSNSLNIMANKARSNNIEVIYKKISLALGRRSIYLCVNRLVSFIYVILQNRMCTCDL